jgi:hypothetical protein
MFKKMKGKEKQLPITMFQQIKDTPISDSELVAK